MNDGWTFVNSINEIDNIWELSWYNLNEEIKMQEGVDRTNGIWNGNSITDKGIWFLAIPNAMLNLIRVLRLVIKLKRNESDLYLRGCLERGQTRKSETSVAAFCITCLLTFTISLQFLLLPVPLMDLLQIHSILILWTWIEISTFFCNKIILCEKSMHVSNIFTFSII